ncbi:hypothetical protein M0804_014774 [Polistes exclamans]|nr:hypothetical protein M0804_014775 [Polistes exclamans]KAI4474580.1 hypothetical protein M0804_014774 [Polistes exclamans]
MTGGITNTTTITVTPTYSITNITTNTTTNTTTTTLPGPVVLFPLSNSSWVRILNPRILRGLA